MAWACSACKKAQADNAHRVFVRTELYHVNFAVKALVRSQLPETLHLCGDCGLKAARAVKQALGR